MKRVLAFVAFCASVGFSIPALAQATYPTTVGSRVNGVVTLQCDASSLNCATISAANPLAVTNGVAQGSTTSGQTGTLVAGAVTTAPPTYVTGQTNPLSLTTTGGTRVTLSVSGSDISGTTTTADGLSTNAVGLFTLGLGQVFNGTSWDRRRGDANGTVVTSALASAIWRYTSGTSPILSNTTVAVTIKTAAGAGVRNYIKTCQITTTAFGASSPLALRDGAAGAVMWAVAVPTGGFLQPAQVTFDPPLQGTANTLVEVVTTTANVTGTVSLNCQGSTGI